MNWLATKIVMTLKDASILAIVANRPGMSTKVFALLLSEIKSERTLRIALALRRSQRLKT